MLADDSSSTCTAQNIGKAQDQTAEPWEIAAADPQTLTDVQGSQLTGSGVTLAVIDTGIQQQAQLNVSSGTVLTGVSSNYANDGDGHGTMVASIIAAQQENGKGMQGIAPGVTLMSVREAGCDAVQGDGNDENSMAGAITYAVNHGAQIVNISQDGYDTDNALQSAVQYAYSKGVLIVTSAGNQGDRDTTDSSGTDYGGEPRGRIDASLVQPRRVLAVGAVDQYGNVAPFLRDRIVEEHVFRRGDRAGRAGRRAGAGRHDRDRRRHQFRRALCRRRGRADHAGARLAVRRRRRPGPRLRPDEDHLRDGERLRRLRPRPTAGARSTSRRRCRRS